MNGIHSVFIMYPVLLFSVTLHEYFHALAANASGDPIPRSQGRLTLNPVAHADLVGTVILPLMGMLFGGFLFGWGKPVQTSPAFYRHPRRDNMFVSFAGPAANLLIITVVAIAVRVMIAVDFYDKVIFVVLGYFVLLNMVLFIFNLIPIPPLDGHHIVESLFPRVRPFYAQIKMMGPFFLIMVLVMLSYTGVFGLVIGYPVRRALIEIFDGVNPAFWKDLVRMLS